MLGQPVALVGMKLPHNTALTGRESGQDRARGNGMVNAAGVFLSRAMQRKISL